MTNVKSFFFGGGGDGGGGVVVVLLRYEDFHDFGTVLRVYALHLLDVFLL